MKVSDVVAEYLEKQGVTHVFGYQGGSITHLVDSIARTEGIEYIQNYNEQGSSLAADAYARTSDCGFGVALATNGPGATNMVTGIANAFCDSVPVVFITGQVHTFAMKQNENYRQESFQEIDILSIVRSITKYAVTILDENKIVEELEKAIQIAKSDRPGPVLIDIPVDIQGKDINISQTKWKKIVPARTKPSLIDVNKVIDVLDDAKKPLILAGGGIRTAKALNIFKSFVKKAGIPVVVSLQGLDVINHDDSEFIGFIGGYGNRYANLAIQNADVIIVLGSRLDMRQTGKRKDLFANYAKIIHIDTDVYELGHFVKEDISLQCDIKEFLEELYQQLPVEGKGKYSEWKKQIDDWRAKYPAEQECMNTHKNNPNKIMQRLGEGICDKMVVCSDVGQNQMWVAQSLRIGRDDFCILNSGGLGTMGYSLPAGIGAHFANQKSQILCLMGDGGFQMNIQELQLIGDKQLPIVVVIMNNKSLGLIREIHEKYYNNLCVGSVEGFSMPDLRKLSEAYQMNYLCIEQEADVSKIHQALQERKPYLVEVLLDESTYVRPELLGNDGLDHQMPYKED